MLIMIVDTHTHLWQNLEQVGPQISARLRDQTEGPWDRFDASSQAHAEAMEAVDVSIVLGFRSQYLGAHIPNALISQYVNESPDSRVGFGGIDPMIDGFEDEIRALPEMGLSGVVISPADQGYHPTHTKALALYERCQSMGLPLAVHQGGPFVRDSMLEYAQPYLFDEIARQFPQLNILLTNCGEPWLGQTLVMLGKHRNVYAELSGLAGRVWELYNTLIHAHQIGVTDRLLFGSNFPHARPQEVIEAMYSLNQLTQGAPLPTVPREKLRAIIERDALVCLGIRSPGTSDATEEPSATEDDPADTAPPPTETAAPQESDSSDAIDAPQVVTASANTEAEPETEESPGESTS
jgi:predicted TIM-barrel fold metal-dependent hydrolase